MAKRVLLLVLPLLLTLLLAACSHTRLVGSEVRQTAAFGPAGAPSTPVLYRFERLPSQTQNPDLERLEQAAQTLLQAKGWLLGEAQTPSQVRYSVMLEWRTGRYAVDTWGRPMDAFMSPHVYPAWGWAGRGPASLGFSSTWRIPPTPHYSHEVRVLVRNVQTGQLVYETQARHDGPWHDGANIAPVVLQAALADFPNPRAAQQTISIELPPQPQP